MNSPNSYFPVHAELDKNSVRIAQEQLSKARMLGQNMALCTPGQKPPIARGDFDPGVAIATTGSRSGKKRWAHLPWQALLASAEATNKYLRAYCETTQNWVLALPPHHVAGFQVLLRAQLANTDVYCNNQENFDAALFMELVSTVPGRPFTALVPTQLQRLVDTGADLSRFSAILVGGAFLPPALDEKAKALGGRLVRTYGMTETAGGCVYDGMPLPEVELQIVENKIAIAGPTLMSGYLDEEDQPFIQRDGRRFLLTNDLGAIQDGILHVEGRADDVIVSGGENISLTRVQRALHEAFGDLRIEVLGVPDPSWGEVVAVAVQGSPAPLAELADQMRQSIKTRLGRASQPKVLCALEQIPLYPNGKLNYRQLQMDVLEQIECSRAWVRQ